MTEENPTNIWKEIVATWDGAEGYAAENALGAIVWTGKSTAEKPYVSPVEMLLVGLAGCTGIDVIDILKKKRQVPVEFKIRVRGSQRIDTYPKAYTSFEVEYLLWGENLIAKDVEQAIQLSEEKYCSVGGTLVHAGPIHSTYRLLKPGQAVE